jgi:hypothetical protein
MKKKKKVKRNGGEWVLFCRLGGCSRMRVFFRFPSSRFSFMIIDEGFEGWIEGLNV